MASIRDVARKAGVAISTVSKVLNHYPNVSEETRIKVNEAIRELKFIAQYHCLRVVFPNRPDELALHYQSEHADPGNR